MDGILNINKPKGNTSFSVVSIVRRLTGELRVGHAGTLDPMASGVLPICLGRGTRIVEFLLETNKVYRAQLELGVSTDTHDVKGRVTMRGDSSAISLKQLEQSLDSFRGHIQQTPPMFSALKHKGRRLYNLAREGITVKRESRAATIHRLELLSFKPPLVALEIECSRGTYIRSLAHDLGELLGCGAHLKELVRINYGPFNIEAAVLPNQLKGAFSNNDWRRLIYPLDTALYNWPSVVVNDEQEQVIKNGGHVVMEKDQMADGNEKRCRAYSKNGCFLALLNFNTKRGQWQPKKVFI